MKESVLTNPEIFPNEALLKKHLGSSLKMYKKILGYTHDQIPEVEEVWNFYRDGQSWLLRLMKKSKTYYWVAFYESSFCTTFYLNSTSENRIKASDIPESLKEEYASTKDRKVRWISLEINSDTDFDTFKKLLEIKARLK
jgi:hypothetical protein